MLNPLTESLGIIISLIASTARRREGSSRRPRLAITVLITASSQRLDRPGRSGREDRRRPAWWKARRGYDTQSIVKLWASSVAATAAMVENRSVRSLISGPTAAARFQFAC